MLIISSEFPNAVIINGIINNTLHLFRNTLDFYSSLCKVL